jgi:hypothetical protein
MSKSKEVTMREELLRMMPVNSDHEWGPQPIVCRWCGCWLEYTDASPGRPDERHKEDCFAALYLGRPAT